jgi:hypothetical protein
MSNEKKKTKKGRRDYTIVALVNMRLLRNYDKKIYSYSFILTDRQRLHIASEHALDYARIMYGLKRTLNDPDEIIEDDKFDGTLYFIRKLRTDNQNIVVKMNISNDAKHPHNSIITSYIVSDRAVGRIGNKGVSIYFRSR